MPPEAVRYCGRLFSEQELELIRTIIADDPSRHRFALSQVVCERLHWRRANGQLKDMSCRVAMLRMHRDRLIPLPAPRRRHSNGTLHRRRTPQAEPELPIIARVDALPALQVRPLADQREAQLWREYVDRYHYLGYTPLPGAQMRYLVTSQRRVLAVVGFGASAWKAAPRDRFIGWSVAVKRRRYRRSCQREARLRLVVNNARFLILPWVQVRNLASTVLARSSRRLPDDCQARYDWLPTAPAGDLRAVRPLRRYQLPRRQLDPRRSDPRPRQTRRASYPRAAVAKERHLALPAQARLPPPTLHPARSLPRRQLDPRRSEAAANSTCIVPTRCPGKTSGSTRSGATSAADSAPRSILPPPVDRIFTFIIP